MLRLAIKSIAVDNQPNGPRWEPDDPNVVATSVMFAVGLKNKKGGDSFGIQVATPAGLAQLDDDAGILAHRPIVVMRSYHFDQLRTWLEKVVASCEAESWNDCVEKLRRHFDWEYSNYTAP
jgi:hypothetical protein